jgi:hypothetical protein
MKNNHLLSLSSIYLPFQHYDSYTLNFIVLIDDFGFFLNYC